MEKKKIIVGSRDSKLAMWQTQHVISLLQKIHHAVTFEILPIKTKGDKILNIALDKIEGKGLFTKELENELLAGNIDFAVHSLKDMPTELPEGMELSAVMERHDNHDVLVTKEPGMGFDDIPQNATIATGSMRRRAQIQRLRPDINIVDLRGNLQTRLHKLDDSDWFGIILAKAGLERLEIERNYKEIPRDLMLPAVGQGALTIEILSKNLLAKEVTYVLNHVPTDLCTKAERSLLHALGGGCKTPIAGYATTTEKTLTLTGLVCSPDGKEFVKDKVEGKRHDAVEIGKELANILKNKGAKEILDKFEENL